MSEGNNNITIGQLTESINDKMDRDGLNANTSWIFVVSKQDPTPENDYTWYRRYSDGWVEQGGLLGNAGTFATRVITMPVAMRDTKYTAVISGSWDNSTGNGSMLDQNKTTTTFGTYATNINNNGSWIVCGYAAK